MDVERQHASAYVNESGVPPHVSLKRGMRDFVSHRMQSMTAGDRPSERHCPPSPKSKLTTMR